MKTQLRSALLVVFAVMFFAANSFAQKLETAEIQQGPIEMKVQNSGRKLKTGEKIVIGTPGTERSLLSEGFEDVTFPPAGWTSQILAGTATVAWLRSAIAGATGGYGLSNASAKMNFFNAPGGDKQTLQSPNFPATTAGELLQFDFAWSGYAGGQTSLDSFQVQYSLDGINFIDLAVWTNDSGASVIPAINFAATAPKTTASANIADSYWSTKRFSLPVGTISIRFLATSGFGNSAYVDNVSTIPAPSAPMTGAYTINPSNPPSATNYQTFTAATYDLFNRGVSGPVTVTVSAGTYAERFVIRSIAGTSSTNTVTFNGGGAATVSTASLQTTSSTTDFFLCLNGCRWVTLNGINFVDIGTGVANQINRGIVLGTNGGMVGARHNTINGCNITLGGNVGGGALIAGASIGIIGTGFVQGVQLGTADSNTINNCKIDNADRGIGYFSILGGNNIPYPHVWSPIVTNNKIGSVLAVGDSLTGTGGAPIGIILQGMLDCYCVGNSIDSLISRHPSATTTTLTGIAAQVASGIFANNRIKYMATTNPTSLAQVMVGIQAGPTTLGNVYCYNNTVTGLVKPYTGAASATIAVTGLQPTNFITGGTPGIEAYFVNNSCYLNNPTIVNYSSYAYRLGVTGAPTHCYNNLMYNATSSSSGTSIHYAIGDANATRNLLVSNYNDLFVSGVNAQIGRYGTTNTLDLATWKTSGASLIDTNSVSGAPVFSSNVLLSPDATNAANWVLNGNAFPLPTLSTDIVGNARSTTLAGGSTDIGAYEFTPSVAPADILVPIAGAGVYDFFSFGRKIASVNVTTPGTMVTLTCNYKSGTNPTGAPGTAHFGNASWTFTPNVGAAGFTYDMTLIYTEGQLGTVSSEAAMIMAKSDNGGTSYTPFLSAVVDPLLNTVTVTGLTSFSIFAISDNVAPLPVELASFSSSTNKNNVQLTWATTMENNNSGFDIERKLSADNQWSRVGNVAGHGNSNVTVSYSYKDNNVATGKYNYRLKQIDLNGNFHYYDLSNEVIVGIPTKFDISQNYPNPFNPSTKINFDLPFDSKVQITLFDMTGRQVATILNANQTAGYQTVSFNASNLSSGAYFYQINATGGSQSFVKTMKMMLVK